MKRILQAQAAYYVATGLLPICSMRAFEALTGKKKDRWLVRMVGLLATSIGLTLAASTREERVDPAVLVLAITASLSFAAIDVIYVANRTIAPIYLGDAAVEFALCALVLNALVEKRADDDDTRGDNR